MKLLLPVSLLLLTGCGGMMSAPPTSTSQQPNYARRPAAVANPAVVIIGDSVVNAWCSAALLAQNPTWACQGSPAGVREETTAEVLARFHAAIALQPKVIAIEAGVWDIEEFDTLENIGLDPCDAGAPNSCQNIQQMAEDAEQAGIYVLVCTIPPWGGGPLAASYDSGDSAEEDLQHGADIGYLNQSITSAQYSKGAAVDMYSLLAVNALGSEHGLDPATDTYISADTADGVDPNTAGGQVMTQAFQKALSSLNAQLSKERGESH